MPTSREAITRQRIQSIIQTVDGIADTDVTLGLQELTADDEFFNDLEAPYVVIEPCEQTGFSFSTRLSEFDIQCLLYFSFAKDASYDFTAIEDIVYAGIRDALAEDTNWTDSPYPRSIKISKPEVAFLSPCIGLYRITLSFMGD